MQRRRGAPTAETEDNGTSPQTLPASGWVSGTVSSDTDVDDFNVTLDAGDTVFATLDLDPERDATTWNGQLGMGLFSNVFITANDASVTSPNGEALFMTVKDAGTYVIRVNSGAAAAAGSYHLNVAVHPKATPAPGVTCTTYASVDVPKVIATGPGTTTSTLTVPSGGGRIDSVEVALNVTHTFMQDLDVDLTTPAGNEVGLFSDIGGSAVSGPHTTMNLVLDDSAALPINSLGQPTSGMRVSPELNYRLAWFSGIDPTGSWTLTLRDDATGDGGTLNSWSITVCAQAPLACPAGASLYTVFSTDFESDDGGFTHSGTQDEWERGLPSAAPLTTCFSGSNCWKTDLDNTYNASSNQDLLSGTLDLTAVSAPIYATWMQSYQMENATFDHANVVAQQTGGGSPVTLWQWLGATMTNSVGNPTVTIQESTGWGLVRADMSSLAGSTAELKFHVDSDTTVQLGGLAIDDVAIQACHVVCGDSTTGGSEECDDGNGTNTDACKNDCTDNVCGDGVKYNGVEACDDGDAVNGDGCDNNCTVTACGNGVKAGSEQCDDGNVASGDGCSATCTTEAVVAGPDAGTDAGADAGADAGVGPGAAGSDNNGGTPGAAGSADEPDAGAQGGAGGSGGSGGRAGNIGLPVPDRADAGDSDAGVAGNVGDDSGCGCRVVGQQQPSTPWQPLALMALTLPWLRRRRARGSY